MVFETLIICAAVYALFSDYFSAKTELMIAEAAYREQEARSLEIDNDERSYRLEIKYTEEKS